MGSDHPAGLKLDAILKGSKHRLNLFRHEEVQMLEERVQDKDGKYFTDCLVRKKQIQLKPEEVVRQLLLARLNTHYGYDFSHMKLEHPVRIGRDASKRADIVIFDKDNPNTQVLSYLDGLHPIKTSSALQETDLSGNEAHCYECGNYSFVRNPSNTTNPSYQTTAALFEVLYQLRNLLFHGQIEPTPEIQPIYQNAYLIMRMLIPKLI